MTAVTKLDFRIAKPQLYRDDWRGTTRVCEFKGLCIACFRRTYAFQDGENDPRGPLGDHACWPLVAADYDAIGADVPMCAVCANIFEDYDRAVTRAFRDHWIRKDA